MDTSIYKKRTVIELLKVAREQYGDHPYMYRKTNEGWKADSFKEVDDKSSAIAAFLRFKLNIQKESKAVLIAEGRPEWMEAEMGVMKAGCISVPLSVKLTIPEIQFRIEHSDANLVIFSSNTAVKTHEALKALDKKVKLLFLDEKSQFKDDRIGELGYYDGDNLFYLKDALSIGKDIINQNPEKVDAMIDEVKEDDVCVISYTSGTSGNPKGVMLMQKNYYTNAFVAVKLFSFKPYELSTVVILPTDHAFAHTVMLYHSLICADAVYFTDARKGNASMLKNFPVNLIEVQPSFLLLVPAILGSFQKKIKAAINAKGAFVKKLFDNGIAARINMLGDGYHKVPFSTKFKNYIPYKIADLIVFPKVRKTMGNPDFIVVGGAALDIKMQKFFNALGVKVVQGYGMTETGPVISACTPFLPNSVKYGTVGRVAPYVECRIVKEDGTLAKTGERGDICVSGDSVMKGYYKNESATDEVLKDGWMNTGDVGFIDEDGFISVVGRSKALLVSTEGEKHSPEEIETEITHESKFINQIVLHNSENPYTIALVTLNIDDVKEHIRANGIKDENALYTSLEEDFNRYVKSTKTNVMWQPAVFIITEGEWTDADGLVNSTMKLVRSKVAAAFKDRMNESYSNKDSAVITNKAILKKMFF